MGPRAAGGVVVQHLEATARSGGPRREPAVAPGGRPARATPRAPDQCTKEDQQLLARLTAQSPALAEAVALARDFTGLVRRRQPGSLEPWLARAATSTLPPFRRFARGLRADYAAVQAGVTLPWNQGPIEGQINRLKMFKRQMFGRAKLDLLARRFLLAACPGTGHP